MGGVGGGSELSDQLLDPDVPTLASQDKLKVSPKGLPFVKSHSLLQSIDLLFFCFSSSGLFEGHMVQLSKFWYSKAQQCTYIQRHMATLDAHMEASGVSYRGF